MIIVNQDKRSIHNLDNLMSISVRPNSDDEKYRVKCTDILGAVTLGVYATEKRAIEVLNKIVNSAGLGMYVYDMPQK